MDSNEKAESPSQEEGDAHLHYNHLPLHPKHAHIHMHRNLKRKREPMKRQEYVQTALDVVVVSGGTTVGDVLLGSIPSNPTTASLPGFGLLTLSSFIPGNPTDTVSTNALTTPAATSVSMAASSESSPAPTAPANASSLTPSMTGSNSTVTSSSSSISTSSSVTWNYGVAVSMNSTSSTILASTSSTTSSLSSLSSDSSSPSTSFMTSTSAFSSTSSPASSTGAGIIGGGAGGPAATSTGAAPTTAAAASDNTDNHAGPIAGGVVGGVAAAAVLGILIFLLLRWYRQRKSNGHALLGDPTDEAPRNAAGHPGAPSSPMTQRSSLVPIAAAARRFRPGSSQTAGTSSTATGAPSERGFQRVGGRKLTSVLLTGGDGYAEPSTRPDSLQPPPAAYGANRDSNLSGTSFYRDSNSHYGGNRIDSSIYEDVPAEGHAASAAATGTRDTRAPPSDSSMLAVDPSSNRGSVIYQSPPTGNPFATPHPRDARTLQAFGTSPGSESSDGIRSPTPDINETLTYREGPLRTPVITGGDDHPLPPPPALRPGHGPDGLGRSRPSWDGSRHSRFSEAI